MRTPGNDDELAAGFLLSEGLIARPEDIARITRSPRNEANAISVFLDPSVQIDFQRLTRHVFASSSCGICGAATIEAIHKSFSPIGATTVVARVSDLLALPQRLRELQETFDRTGGLHAAGIFTLDGKVLVVREDVGRHNAVDKVLGFGLLQRLLPFDRHILVVSGRASFEIMQKALAGRIPIVVAVSAPSSLAVEFAEQSGQTLVGFLRRDRLNVYSHPERVQFS